MTTHDMIGGNSGSAVIDVDGKIAGLIFDGNLPSVGGTYVYDGTKNRSIMLSGKLIKDALSKVYDYPIIDQ